MRRPSRTSTPPEPRRVRIPLGPSSPLSSATDSISIPLGRHEYSPRRPRDFDEDSVNSENSEAEEVPTDVVDEEESEEESESESEGEAVRPSRRVLQKDLLCIGKVEFCKTVREIGAETAQNGPIGFSGGAMDLLQTESEKMLVKMFTASDKIAEAAGRQKLKVSDVYAARQVANLMKKSSH
ncbi:unnamed protein product [Caenorhabditis sp. 36 PRJEB53466]|nr:unnamed protein product [Caenorhabditis sp. 36 PRJEB53466]